MTQNEVFLFLSDQIQTNTAATVSLITVCAANTVKLGYNKQLGTGKTPLL